MNERLNSADPDDSIRQFCDQVEELLLATDANNGERNILEGNKSWEPSRWDHVWRSLLSVRSLDEPAKTPERKPGPRFVLLVGAIREEYPDLPEAMEGQVVCWDRQERHEVFTVFERWGQVLCLELVGEAGPQGMCNWLNGLSDEALKSEGLPVDSQVWD